MEINAAKYKHFGEIDIDENKIINFRGIPGFENSKFIVYTTGETSFQMAPMC